MSSYCFQLPSLYILETSAGAPVEVGVGGWAAAPPPSLMHSVLPKKPKWRLHVLALPTESCSPGIDPGGSVHPAGQGQ